MSPWSLPLIVVGAAVLAGLLILAELAWVYRRRLIASLKGRPLAGCCGNCDGFGGDASTPETGGRCWDCQGTGHAHAGRCRWAFLDWWHLKEGAVAWTAMVWTVLTTAFGAPLLMGTPWVGLGSVLSVGPSLLAILGLIFLGRAADRQISRCGLPQARHR